MKFESLYRRHVSALKWQGKADKTIDVYARAVRRVAQFWDLLPDKLTQEQLEAHFDALVASHSWSTVKVDRNGLQFFYEHVLKRPWRWVDIVKPPRRTLPGEDFMALLLQHVLPKGLRRARDYGFLHGNAKRILKIVQWVLRVPLSPREEKGKAQFRCPHCHGRMLVIRMRPPRLQSG